MKFLIVLMVIVFFATGQWGWGLFELWMLWLVESADRELLTCRCSCACRC